MFTVALDIGGVCIELRRKLAFGKFGLDPKEPLPEIMAENIRRYETGKMNTEEWLGKCFDYFQGKMSRLEIADAWNLIIGDALPGMTEAVSEFAKRGVKFVFLSDISELHMTEVRRNLPFAHLVSDGILSYEAGFCKPSPEIYAAFEARHGVPNLYFDDLMKNIEGARARGWNAVQFQSPEQFRQVLSETFEKSSGE